MELYWYWIVCGIILILMEFIVPGFVICFFGISALATAVVDYFFPACPLAGQLLVFALGGVVMAFLCRKCFAGKENRRENDIDCDDVAGEICVCREEITAETPGKVEFRGSLWKANADSVIAPGEYCVVESRDNLTLTVHRK